MQNTKYCALAIGLASFFSGLATDGKLRAQEKNLLITASELDGLSQVAHADLAVLDVRTHDNFVAGHIPGARWLDANAWRDKSQQDHGLDDESFWSKQLGQLGLEQSSRIVVVGDALPESSRIWWLLRYLGMPQVSLLDGGQAAWVEGKLPLSTDGPAIQETSPTIRFQRDRLATLADVVEVNDPTKKCAILDNRTVAEFSGERGVGTRLGHMPGAHHLEWNRFVSKSGKFLTATEIKQLLESEAIDVNSPMVTHCQTGGRSSVAAFALELAGVKDVKNYYRGWSEYAGELTAPVEKK